MTVDVEGFVGWLRARGVPEPNLELYRRGAEVIAGHVDAPPLRPRHLEATLRAEERAGASARRLANLNEVGTKLLEFAAQPPAAEAVAAVAAPRPGCECPKAQDLFVEGDWGVYGTAAAAVAGASWLGAAPLIGNYGATSITLGVLALGGVVTTTSVTYRCTVCQQKIRGPFDADERKHLWEGRLIVVGLTVAFALGSLFFLHLWRGRVADELGLGDEASVAEDESELDLAEDEVEPE